jgi:hypothetical protein
MGCMSALEAEKFLSKTNWYLRKNFLFFP